MARRVFIESQTDPTWTDLHFCPKQTKLGVFIPSISIGGLCLVVILLKLVLLLAQTSKMPLLLTASNPFQPNTQKQQFDQQMQYHNPSIH